MPKINLCFLWHMHQPLYKDLVHGEYRLPWTRLHALKDYFGMVNILKDFPAIRQTFNLVPSLLLQIEEYATGRASDPFLALALKPAELLSRSDKELILKYFFQANEARIIRRYPRYSEMNELMKHHGHSVQKALSSFDTGMLRDLQVLSQLAWFDEHYLEDDPEIKQLAAKGRDYTVEDQKLIGEKEAETLGNVINAYKDAATRGQIEIATSPFYHPILPLLCDSNVAGVSHPYLMLPNRFAWPEDAEEQLLRAATYIESTFGTRPVGLWPSEGAVSDVVLGLAAKAGFRWVASGQGVITATVEAGLTGELPSGNITSTPYVWKQNGAQVDMIFRDHRLSDLIGFVYSHMEPEEAAIHFVDEIHRAAARALEAGRDALVTVILDGENAWESYARNGRPFLRELYTRLSSDQEITTRTVSEAVAGMDKEELKHIFPGSWIGANFDTWIGEHEENLAWEHLREARATFDRVVRSAAKSAVAPDAIATAREELLIAEGSDWFWWYGPDYSSVNKSEFDQLFRDHLTNVYQSLGVTPPAALSQPVTQNKPSPHHEHPTALIQPTIDGKMTSPGEWAKAGRFRVDPRSGAMHRPLSFARDFFYGSDGRDVYFRVDLAESVGPETALEFRFIMRSPAGDLFSLRVSGTPEGPCDITTDVPGDAVTAAIGSICEARVSLSAMKIRLGEPLFLQVEVLRDGLPVAFIPANGEMELGSGVMAAYAF
ncbi:MAG TPA: glycoside hydrolase family 57 protein [Bryobacteraceae bacterium]|jgi:alpha-amylase/alpha-mannosidase (GH57 family)|nr:glycoside hydrolase family 57 protein [Bryobacteraceae bacterium]